MLSAPEKLPNLITFRLKTAPVNLPISLTETKNYLRVDHNDEDAQITSLIKAATGRAEKLTNLKFITQTWYVNLDDFPRDARFFDLKIGYVQSVTSIKYYDEDNTETTWDSANYILEKVGAHGSIGLKSGAVWPDYIPRRKGSVVVELVVGFGANDTDVPEDIRTALLEITSALYDKRGDEERAAIPKTAMALLGAFRVWP